MTKRSLTTKDISLLYQLYKNRQLELDPEFQRNSVWPRPAKAYLIDTILNDRPIPLFFLQRTTSPQTGRSSYAVIDGQQRLRAVFEFLEDKLDLAQSHKTKPYYKKRFSQLRHQHRDQILQYDLTIEELSGYSEPDIRDMFVRMNKYVVKLSRQEIRHARGSGAFRDLVEQLGRLPFWRENRIFTPHQIARFRAVEFSAELVILLVEGPQDKKKAIDLYYGKYQSRCPFAREIRTRLQSYINWIANALPELSRTRFRKPVDLYSLVGALHEVSCEGKQLQNMHPQDVHDPLLDFDKRAHRKHLSGIAAKYVAAASQQTDNIRPRTTRIEVIANIIRRVYE